jgi:hypothetical protein
MKVLLTIGYTDILLPDETGVQNIMKTLARGINVDAHLYKNEITLKDGDASVLKVEMAMVNAKVKFIRDGVEVETSAPARKPKQLNPAVIHL